MFSGQLDLRVFVFLGAVGPTWLLKECLSALIT